MKIPGPEAFETTLRNKARHYPNRDDQRSQGKFLFPQITPGFKIRPDQSVFTIGSCFARNVEEALVQNGITVPTADFRAPSSEAPGRPNRILNQYNPGTMLQCVQAISQPVSEAVLYKANITNGLNAVVDCLLATGSRAVNRKRALERRQQIRDLYATGLEQSEIVVITLGLIEAWYDNDAQLYLNEAPPRKLVKASPERFELRQMDVQESMNCINQMLELLIENGRRNIILTVSPVPLQVTFAGGDAVTRNTYSKSVLRVVAEEAQRNFSHVDYFPSYECVTSGGLAAFGEDNVHVRPVLVDRVVNYMVSRYLEAAPSS